MISPRYRNRLNTTPLPFQACVTHRPLSSITVKTVTGWQRDGNHKTKGQNHKFFRILPHSDQKFQ